jgi:membrane-bound serine protease (ClpP class)
MVLCLLGALVGAGRGPAAAAAPAPTAPVVMEPEVAGPVPPQPARVDAASPMPHIDVIQLNGLIDPIEANFLRRSIANAERGGALALVVQLSSSGGVISAANVDALSQTITRSEVPVAVWVGPNGSRAYRAAYAILRAALLRGVAPGTRVGYAPPSADGVPDPLAGRSIGAGEALALKVATISAPTLGDFIVSLDGQVVGGTVLHTAEVVTGSNGELRRRPTVDTTFHKLTLLQQLLHTAASPSVAYLLLVIGLLLAALEFFTAGVGIAAFCAAVALVLASYGLGALPIRPWALALIAVGILGFCIDLQAGVPRVWTAFGAITLIAGTLFLYQHVQMSPLAMLAGVGGAALFMLAGMPAMVRARFSTPTIGRDSMIGEVGVALAGIEPEGTVEVRGAPWRARTNRATPIAAGATIRVVAIDGLLLEVEPEHGGARDARH